jgi:siderophore-iron reductase FhuF
MAQLEPLRSRYKDIGVLTAPPDDSEVVPAMAFLNGDTLRATLERFSSRVGTSDLRIVGIHWLGQYTFALAPPVLMAMTRAGIGVDASIGNVSIVQPDGSPASMVLHDTSGTVVYAPRYADPSSVSEVGRPVASAVELRRFVLDGLLSQHLTPLVEQVHALAGSPRQILWNQVAYECAGLFYSTLARVAPEARNAAYEDDWAALFDARDLEDGAPNPLYRPMRPVTAVDPETGEPETWNVRTSCCLIYRVDTDRLCGACALGLKEEQVVEKLTERDERRAERRAAGD